MIKFIIEVEDEYVHQCTDAEYIKENPKKDSNAFIGVILDMLSFTQIEREMKKGTTEFVIKPSTSEGGTPKKSYEMAVSYAAAAYITQGMENEENVESDNKNNNSKD